MQAVGCFRCRVYKAITSYLNWSNLIQTYLQTQPIASQQQHIEFLDAQQQTYHLTTRFPHAPETDQRSKYAMQAEKPSGLECALKKKLKKSLHATYLVSGFPSGGQTAGGRVCSTKNFALQVVWQLREISLHSFDLEWIHSLLFGAYRGSLNFFPGMKTPHLQFLKIELIG